MLEHHSHTHLRADLRHDLVAIMWEKVFIFKAACDALLGIILLISAYFSRRRPALVVSVSSWTDLAPCIDQTRGTNAGLSVPPKGMVCKAMGVLYQFEEVMTLGIIIRMAQHPFYFMLKREDMNECVYIFIFEGLIFGAV